MVSLSPNKLQQHFIPSIDWPGHAPMQAILRRGSSIRSPFRNLVRVSTPIWSRMSIRPVPKRLSYVHEHQLRFTTCILCCLLKNSHLLSMHYICIPVPHHLFCRANLPGARSSRVPSLALVMIRRIGPQDG